MVTSLRVAYIDKIDVHQPTPLSWDTPEEKGILSGTRSANCKLFGFHLNENLANKQLQWKKNKLSICKFVS